MIPLVAAIVLAGAAGAGPVLVSDACGTDTTDNVDARCAVAEVERVMKTKQRPKELKSLAPIYEYCDNNCQYILTVPTNALGYRVNNAECLYKVETDGKLYSVPEQVEMVQPAARPLLEGWWQEFVVRVATLVNRNEKEKSVATSGCCSAMEIRCPSGKESNDDVPSVGDHSCQICFEHEHSTVMLPCGHGGVCWDCGVQMFALTEECPMCRNKIDLLVRLDYGDRREAQDEQFVSVICA